MAGTASGVGKTTVATGVMAALRRAGLQVAAAKVGPDFIDPGYHALATGRPGRNLDEWMCGAAAICSLAAEAAAGADLLVVEGVMGLFDGVGATTEASTAAVAKALQAPVVLVVDASAMSGSVAAVVHGFRTHDPDLVLGGVVLNRVGSDAHGALLRAALAPLGIPVLGVLRRDDALVWRDRHLGLVPVVEQPTAVHQALDRLAVTVAANVDLQAVIDLARRAPQLQPPSLPAARPVGTARVAVAGGPAFSFTYPDNLERLVEAGAELVPVDPLHDPCLPDGTSALYAGGGFPEVFAEALAANVALLADVRRRYQEGLVVWAECGGLLWLARSLDGHQLCGVVDASGTMTPRLTLGYRTAQVRVANPVAAAGTVLRGHEFHYSTLEPCGDALVLASRSGTTRGGFAGPRLFASYLHLHLGSEPAPAERFVAAAAAANAAAGRLPRRG